MSVDFSGFFALIYSFFLEVLGFFATALLAGSFLFALRFFWLCRLFPWQLSAGKLRQVPAIKQKYFNLARWVLIDLLERSAHKSDFKEFGFTFFVGRQGTGKTISMVDYLERMRAKYPDCPIVTNFNYQHATHKMTDWRDLLEIRNGVKGVIFAIDEIHSEYSAASWKDFPESILSEVSQQRKQRVKIVATSQFFGRVAKPLREQAFSIVVCNTWFKRLTTCREYDAFEYASYDENPAKLSKKLKSINKYSFVQSDRLRQVYDTYEKIERMKKVEFIPRGQREQA